MFCGPAFSGIYSVARQLIFRRCCVKEKYFTVAFQLQKRIFKCDLFEHFSNTEVANTRNLHLSDTFF